ncbi:MAG: hypothetical protein FJ319_06215 [SAR202 cluster bacterium]|nr:hypothetical protein [SAR202 cluster bacterium]
MTLQAFGRKLGLRVFLLGVPISLLLAGCVVTDEQAIVGTLNEIDCANGDLTVVTDEGKTFHMTIDTPDCQQENLATGQRVEVDVEGDDNDNADTVKVVNNIKVVQSTTVNNQTTVTGKIVNVQNDQVRVLKSDGEEVVIKVDDDKTKVKKNNRDTNVEDLRDEVNVNVVIKIDQTTNVAQTIEVNVDDDGGKTTPTTGTTPTPARTPNATSPAASPTAAPTVTPTSAPMTAPTGTPAATPQAAPVGGPSGS